MLFLLLKAAKYQFYSLSFYLTQAFKQDFVKNKGFFRTKFLKNKGYF
jgi:hypothetical protein